jgi:hypothetical protein
MPLVRSCDCSLHGEHRRARFRSAPPGQYQIKQTVPLLSFVTLAKIRERWLVCAGWRSLSLFVAVLEGLRIQSLAGKRWSIASYCKNAMISQ